MKLAAFASEPQYARAILPIWQALDPDERTVFGALEARDYVQHRAVEAHPGRIREDVADAILVASFQDSLICRDYPLVYAEHGAGQTYPGCPQLADHGSYSGGANIENVTLFLCPSKDVAERWQKRYPGTRTAVVGCPALDVHLAEKARATSRVVAFAFHWEGGSMCPELTSAWPAYREAVAALARQRPVIVTGHPRSFRRFLRTEYDELRLRSVEDADVVINQAGVLVADNTSLAMEFAALDRPIVWLNVPEYRRDVDHGGRFWEWVRAGIVCDHPDELPDAVECALKDPPAIRDKRRKIVREVYAGGQGAAQRAVAAIREHFAGR